MLKQLIQSFGTVLLFALSGPLTAQTQDEFDCQSLLSSAGFLESTEISGAMIFSRIGWTVSNDPVSVREILDSRTEPYLLTDSPSDSNAVKLGCKLIVVELVANKDPNPDQFRFLNNTRLPVLLVRTFETAADAETKAKKWAAKNFNISAFFNGKVETDGTNLFLKLDSQNLSEPRYLGLKKGNVGHSRSIKADGISENIKKFFQLASVKEGMPIFVLCGGVNCESMKSFVKAAVPTPTRETKKAILKVEIKAPSAQVSAQRSGPNIKIKYNDGRVEDAQDLGIDRLDCILLALGADVFEDRVDCTESGSQMAKLTALKARIDVSNNGTWVIKEGAAVEMPEQVFLKIPAVLNYGNCRFDLHYTDTDGVAAKLELEPRRQADGSLRTGAAIKQPFLINQNQVRATLVNVAPVENCDFTDQEVTLPVQKTLEIGLGVGDAKREALAHVFLIDGKELEERLGLDPLDAADLARKSVDAVQAAHFRLSKTSGSQAWSLDNLTMGNVSGRGVFNKALELGSDALRNRILGSFKKVNRFRTKLINSRMALDAKALEKAISPLQDKATEDGLTALTVTLLSYVQPDTSDETVDPCKGELFTDAVARLNTRPGVPVQFKVFSIMRHIPSTKPLDTSRLQPRGFSPAALGEGGAYTCDNGDLNVTIYPFIVEPWRDSVDVAARYTTALSDQLVLIIKDTISGSGVN